MTGRMLVAGIGNVFLGDDAFGVEVVQRLAREQPPAGVELLDVGIRGVHLAYQLMDGYEVLVLVDAVSRGDAPGTVTVLEPTLPHLAPVPLDPHRLEPGPLLASIVALGALPARVVLVGCEPADLDEGMGLSPAVDAAVGPAVDAVHGLVDEFLAREVLVQKGSDGDAQEAAAPRGARSDRVGDLPPAGRHRAVRADQADVSHAARSSTATTGRGG
jgi:hydrogenase maturation protease